MEIKILYEDNNLIIVEKPAGILSHPTLANEENSLTNWLTDQYPEINNQNWPDPTRPGIVHRLDKETSGLIVLAKNPEILEKLQAQFKEREISKTYIALAFGDIEPKEGEIEAAITRGDAGLQKVLDQVYSFSKEKIRPAVTKYKVIENLNIDNQKLSLVEVRPKTGRMHQIRVHLKHIGHPIIGDPLYNTKESRQISDGLNLHRQFLHASKLEFIHPKTGEKLAFESELPNDLQSILERLNE